MVDYKGKEINDALKFNEQQEHEADTLYDIDGDTPTISFTYNQHFNNGKQLVQVQQQLRKNVNASEESEIEVFNIH